MDDQNQQTELGKEPKTKWNWAKTLEMKLGSLLALQTKECVALFMFVLHGR